ncbi:MAG: hypothetical protein MK135_10600, partial [Polyangiaceae bacterium]|nr:hypothetical protein [Polyangiaceae bacterium]
MYKTSKQTTLPTLLATGVVLLTSVAACSGSDAAEDEQKKSVTTDTSGGSGTPKPDNSEPSATVDSGQ